MTNRHLEKTIRRFAGGVVLGLLMAGSVLAETNKVGTSAAAFLRIPAGARGSALGSALTTQSGDATSLFWNPGASARLEGTQLSFDYSDWLPGLNYGFVGATMPASGSLKIGVHAVYLSTDEMDITTPEFPMGTGLTYNAASTAVGATVASNLTDRFSIGGTIKVIQERIYNSTANGIAFDAGTLFNTPFNNIKFGVAITNVGTKLRMTGEDLNVRVDVAPDQDGNNESTVGELKTDRFDPPLILRLGLSGDLFRSSSSRLTWMVDGINPNDNAPSINMGAELGLMQEVLNLRVGYNDLFLVDGIRGLTFGVGIRALSRPTVVYVDYGFQAFEYLGSVNRFTVSLVL